MSAMLPKRKQIQQGYSARSVRCAAPMLPNELIEDRAPFGQPLERTDLVSAHETAVAFDIRCEDCDEASADFHRV